MFRTIITALLTLSLKRNNMTELFEDNQRDLERAVENLGYSLEQNPEPDSITKLRTDITNQAVRELFLRLGFVGLANERRTCRNDTTSSWTIP